MTALLKVVVPLNPRDALIRKKLAVLSYNAGIHLQKQGKAQETIAAYREAIGLTSSYTPPYNTLALILASQGKSDETILLYKKAVKINPDL